MKRRSFLQHSLAAASVSALLPATVLASPDAKIQRHKGTQLKLCLNAYTFNRQLRSGMMKMEDVIDFCAEHEVDGVDMTGYYFPGYPEVPSDEIIYSLKRYAFLNGVTISGTGVRNDFAIPDPLKRKQDIQMVKDWIEVAAKLGSDVVRVFSGKRVDPSSTFEETLKWMIPAFQQCAEHGKQHGVIVGLQHHDDFLKTADQTIQVVNAVDSPWFSVILDVGSLRENVYKEIEKLLPYTATWQVKEEVWGSDKLERIDLPRLKTIIESGGYRGFIPIEVLGKDATVAARVKRVAEFVADVRRELF